MNGKKLFNHAREKEGNSLLYPLGNSLLYQTATFNLIAFIALLESQERNGRVRGQLYPQCSSHLILIIFSWSSEYQHTFFNSSPSTGGNKGALSAIRLKEKN